MTAASAVERAPLVGGSHRFVLPAELEASVPPEARGLTRDAVRLLVAHRGDGSLVHATFSELPRFLEEGDLVVAGVYQRALVLAGRA